MTAPLCQPHQCSVSRNNLPCLQGRGTGLKAGGGVVPSTEALQKRYNPSAPVCALGLPRTVCVPGRNPSAPVCALGHLPCEQGR